MQVKPIRKEEKSVIMHKNNINGNSDNKKIKKFDVSKQGKQKIQKLEKKMVMNFNIFDY